MANEHPHDETTPDSAHTPSQQGGGKPSPGFERDAYPKMIVVCIAITVVLLLIIFGVMFIDFVVEQPEVEGFEHFEAPGDGASSQIAPSAFPLALLSET